MATLDENKSPPCHILPSPWLICCWSLQKKHVAIFFLTLTAVFYQPAAKGTPTEAHLRALWDSCFHQLAQLLITYLRILVL